MLSDAIDIIYRPIIASLDMCKHLQAYISIGIAASPAEKAELAFLVKNQQMAERLHRVQCYRQGERPSSRPGALSLAQVVASLVA